MENLQESITDALDTATLPDPLELMNIDFRRTSIIGVGLIGGSIGMRMKAMGHMGTIIGYDKPEVLDEALSRGAIDRGVGDLSEAIADADLIVIATPIDEAHKLLPSILKMAKAGAVVTDTGPAKAILARQAAAVSGVTAHFVGGHPLAGSHRQGVSNADASLFENAYWLLTPQPDTPQSIRESLWWWVRMLGAYPQSVEPELHDRIAAMTTHVPFILAVALSQWMGQQNAGIPLLSKLATGYFQSMTGMAALPMGVWEAVLKENKAEVESAMDSFRASLDACIKGFRDDKLEENWQQGHAFQRKLIRERPGDWDSNCELVVTVPDRPGTIARVAGLLAAHDIGIRDIHVIYIRERRGGTLKIALESRSEARRAMEVLVENSYTARFKD